MGENKDISALLNTFRSPEMTPIETGLKHFFSRRPDVAEKVLTDREMAEYVYWMAESYDKDRNTEQYVMDLPAVPAVVSPADSTNTSSDVSSAVPSAVSSSVSSAFPFTIHGEEFSKISASIQSKATGREIKDSLYALFGTPEESLFFTENQDITAGRFLRYMPAYWRKDEYFEVYYVFSGTLPVYFEKEKLLLPAGSVLILPPGVKKACSCPSDDCCSLFFMIRKSTFSRVFWSQLSSRNLMAEFFRRALNEQVDTPYLLFETQQDETLEFLLYSIYSEYQRNRKYTSELLNSLMSSFLLRLLQEYEETVRVSKNSELHWNSRFAEILLYVQENYPSLTLDQLSDKFGYSRRQLIRIIRATTGSTFTELQTRLRMEKATRALLARTASVESIAYEVGFEDRTSFYRAFSRYYGCTPGEYLNTVSD